jgi:hypothetical protein
VTDAAALNFIIGDVLEGHRQLKIGEPLKLGRPSPSYFEFVTKSEQQLKKDRVLFVLFFTGFYLPLQFLEDRLWQYWKGQLGGAQPNLQFNFATKGTLEPSKPGNDTYHFHLGTELKLQLETVAKQLRASVFHLLMTGFMLLLRKYTNQDDILTFDQLFYYFFDMKLQIVVGTAIDTRNKYDLANMVGFCVEILLIKGVFSGNSTVPTAVSTVCILFHTANGLTQIKVTKSVVEAFSNVLPLPVLQKKLDTEFGTSSLQAVMNYLQQFGSSLSGTLRVPYSTRLPLTFVSLFRENN